MTRNKTLNETHIFINRIHINLCHCQFFFRWFNFDLRVVKYAVAVPGVGSVFDVPAALEWFEHFVLLLPQQSRQQNEQHLGHKVEQMVADKCHAPGTVVYAGWLGVLSKLKCVDCLSRQPLLQTYDRDQPVN